MDNIYQTANARLVALGYRISEDDRALLSYSIAAAEADLKARTNRTSLPSGLLYVLADMAAAHFLLSKKTSGTLGDSFNFSASVKSITEGDTSVTFALGDSSPEERFETLLKSMLSPPEASIAPYRRFIW